MGKLKKYMRESIKYSLRSPVFIARHVKQVERLYALSKEDLRRRDEERFLKIFRTAITKSPFYRELYAGHGITIDDIRSIEDISKLPVIDKRMIGKNPDSLLTRPKLFMSKGTTSGTTGYPLTLYQDYFSILRRQAYLFVFRKRRGFTYGERLVSLRGHLGRDLLKLKVDISNTLYLSSYRLNEDTVGKYYDEISAFSPVAIEGYPSSLYNLCCFLRGKGLKLSIPACFTSSETLLDYQRKAIEETLNTEIYDHYGLGEQTIALSECLDHRGYFSEPGYSVNEFRGDCMITTSLSNSSFPLIRYRVDDVVTLSDVPVWKDNELSIVKSVEGRNDDRIISKKGPVLGLNFFNDLEHIKIAQIIQREKGSIEINVAPDGDFSERDKDALLLNIDKQVGLSNIDVVVNIVDDSDIIYTKRNKFRQIISYLKP